VKDGRDEGPLDGGFIRAQNRRMGRVTSRRCLPSLGPLALSLLFGCLPSQDGPEPDFGLDLSARVPDQSAPVADLSQGPDLTTAPDLQSPWKLTWSDEFTGPKGQAPDTTKWVHDTGAGGWGNNELEYYTSLAENASLDGNGNLAIVAEKKTYMGSSYTSARLKTEGTFAQAYGRFEARIKLPTGQGIWPAFWMLGNNIAKNPWPACGEVDVMENIGSQPSVNHGSAHGPGYSGGQALTASYTLPAGAKFADDFHIFALEWEMNTLRFYVDDTLYETRTPADLPAGKTWVFDHPFFLLLNVAVGGTFPGNPDNTTQFPQTMLVDYVRVYEMQ
jgi:beta-glucanase (GH16 family)